MNNGNRVSLKELYAKCRIIRATTLPIGDGNDKFEFVVKHRLNAAEVSGIIETVSNGVVDYETGAYHPELRDYYLRVAVINAYSNSQEHHTASAERKQWLSNRNLQLGTMLAQYGVKTHRDNGTWYMDGSSQLLYDKYRKYIYHNGGIAGDNPTLRQKEILAVLEKGEAVLDDKKQEELHRLIRFTTELSDEFSNLMKSSNMSRILAGPMTGLEDAKGGVPSNISNQEIRIEFNGDTYITGTNEETVEKHKEVTRQFANEIFNKLNIKR